MKKLRIVRIHNKGLPLKKSTKIKKPKEKSQKIKKPKEKKPKEKKLKDGKMEKIKGGKKWKNE